MQQPKKIAVVGSGLVGTVLSIYLRKHGHEVHVYDRSPDIRHVEFSGRSINLALSHRGWKTLEGIGIADAIKEIGIPMEKRAIHTGVNDLVYQYYGKEGETIYSLSRGLLNRKMIDLAEKKGVEFKFNQKIWDITLSDGILHIGETERGNWTEVKYDLVFGADGAFSRIRHRMQRQSMFDYEQKFLPLGYKELHIPANEDGTHKLEKHSLHIWPRGEYMLIALPNLDGSFTCTLFMPFMGEYAFDNLKTNEDVEEFFNQNFPDTRDVISDLARDFFKNPTSNLVTIQCYPWTYKDKVALIGDACHAIVPFYGQGMNVGFEDVTVLDQLMNELGDDWATIFSNYQQMRKPNADAIAELSFRNFMEMSSKTADADFHLMKKIEKWFSDKHPDLWMPLYSRVTFSDQTYSEALEMGDKQQSIMEEILRIDDIENKWNSEEVEAQIKRLLKFKNVN